jgi:hypothetical protein
MAGFVRPTMKFDHQAPRFILPLLFRLLFKTSDGRVSWTRWRLKTTHLRRAEANGFGQSPSCCNPKLLQELHCQLRFTRHVRPSHFHPSSRRSSSFPKGQSHLHGASKSDEAMPRTKDVLTFLNRIPAQRLELYQIVLCEILGTPALMESANRTNLHCSMCLSSLVW